jgi:predicted nuclease of restriction endonuclease-like (RecB) superfamily
MMDARMFKVRRPQGGMNMAGNVLPHDYSVLLMAIKQRIRTGQYEALRAVNTALIGLYWDIGSLIVERQAGATWGRAVVEQLAADLQAEFPGIQGFSSRNLWYMRTFYETYADNQKLQQLVAEIGWSHNIVIIERCKNDLQREFYLRMTRRMGWSRNVLIHQIENQTYEKTLLNQANFEQTLPEPLRDQARLALKDEYTFDFLELGDQHNERQLEVALLANVAAFLREMGGMFAFVGSQYRLEVGDKEYFIDVLLYHRRLRCLIAIDLKVGEFVPEYVGKMQFYLAALDDTVREEGESPSIGIILCKSKDKMIVEYALRESSKPIGVATYRIVSTLPHELADQLPTPDQITRLLEGV